MAKHLLRESLQLMEQIVSSVHSIGKSRAGTIDLLERPGAAVLRLRDLSRAEELRRFDPPAGLPMYFGEPSEEDLEYVEKCEKHHRLKVVRGIGCPSEQFGSCCSACAGTMGAIMRAVQASLSLELALDRLVKPTTDARVELIARLASEYLEGTAEKFLKYCFCFWSAKALREELPLSIGRSPRLWRGQTWIKVKRLMQHPTARFELAQALLVAKRACPVVSEEMCEGAVEDCIRGLTKPRKPLPEWFPHQIERTVLEVFRGERCPVAAPAKLPSMRACWADDSHLGTRKSMGALGLWHGTVTTAMRLCERDFVGFARHRERVVPLYDKSNLVITSLTAWVTAGLAWEIENPRCIPVPVRESLKVRVITKGPPRLQYIGKYLQSWLWGVLRRHPVFQLVGRPLEPGMLTRFFEDVFGRPRKLCSGDYKAATDNLSGAATDLCWEAICFHTGVPVWLEVLGQRILTEHVICDSLDNEIAKQVNGQLMGSVLSFILLCLVNACVCRYAMEVAEGHEISLSEANLLVNGDDCLFPLPCAGKHWYTDVDGKSAWSSPYELWQRVTSDVGLQMSLGKNYFSAEFCVINSRMFRPCSPKECLAEDSFVYKIRFENPGLVLGLGRVASTSDAEEESEGGLVSRCWDLLTESCQTRREHLIDRYLYFNSDRLKEIGHPQQSWFLPRMYGGLGLPRPLRYKWENVSPVARKICRYLGSQPNHMHAMRLSSPAMPRFVKRGLEEANAVKRSLGLQDQVVSVRSMWSMEQEDSVLSFLPFAMTTGTDTCRLSNAFERLLGVKCPLGENFPRDDLCSVRSSFDWPKQRVRMVEDVGVLSNLS